MWLIISGDGDIDYTSVYGPFATKEEADAVEVPEDDGDDAYRVIKLESPEDLVLRLQESDEL